MSLTSKFVCKLLAFDLDRQDIAGQNVGKWKLNLLSVLFLMLCNIVASPINQSVSNPFRSRLKSFFYSLARYSVLPSSLSLSHRHAYTHILTHIPSQTSTHHKDTHTQRHTEAHTQSHTHSKTHRNTKHKGAQKHRNKHTHTYTHIHTHAQSHTETDITFKLSLSHKHTFN